MSTQFVQPSLFTPPPSPTDEPALVMVINGLRFSSFEEVRTWFYGEAERRGLHCPLCDQFSKVYRRKLNSQMARSLILIYRFFETNRDEWVDINNYLLRFDIHPGKANVSLLRHWKLIERRDGEREDGNPRTGFYRLTENGRLFVQGRLLVPTYIKLYNDELLELEQHSFTDIHQALGNKFNYTELMNNE